MGPWAGGSNYAPVFDSSFIAHVHYSVIVNPVLLSPAQYVVWDLRSSLDTAAISSPNGVASLESIRSQPATSPRLTRICIVSDSFSWALRVSALKKSTGITVGDVLDFLADFFSTPLGSGDLKEATPSHRAAMDAVYKERISRSFGPSSLCVHDWMLGRSSFGGFVHDPSYTSSDILGRAGEVYLRLTLKECQ
ncbi:hypothetical protein CPB85DRAFT_1358759 [Mucidula mucida]|nr:hypothetical protein CPB85DRAFT_1358759 [Mucidula mucida]